MGMFASPNRAAVMNSLPPERPRRRRRHEPDLPELGPGDLDRDLLHAADHRPRLDPALDPQQRPGSARRRARRSRTGSARRRRSRSSSPPSSATTRSNTWSAPARSHGLPAARPRGAHRPELLPAPDRGPVQRRASTPPSASRSSPVSSPPRASLLRGGRYQHGEEAVRRAEPRRQDPRNWRSNMRVEWHGQSAFTLSGEEAKVFIDPFGDMSVAARARDAVGLPADRGRRASTCCWSPTSTSTTTGSRRSTASRTMLRSTAGTHESPLGEVVGDRLRARRGRRHRARPEHDLRLRARRPADRPLRRLRPGGAAPRAGGGDRRGRPASSCRSAAARRSAARRRPRSPRELDPRLGGADALPDAADRLPRGRGGVRRGDARRSSGSRRRASTPPS